MSSRGLTISGAIWGSILMGISACSPNFDRNSGTLEVHLVGITEQVEQIELLVQQTGPSGSALHLVEEISKANPGDEHKLTVENVPAGIVSVSATPHIDLGNTYLPTKSLSVYVSSDTTTIARILYDLSHGPSLVDEPNLVDEPRLVDEPQVLPDTANTLTSTTIYVPITLKFREAVGCAQKTPFATETCRSLAEVIGQASIRRQTIAQWTRAYRYFGKAPDGAKFARLAVRLSPSQKTSKLSETWTGPIQAHLTDGTNYLAVGTATTISTGNLVEFQIIDAPDDAARQMFTRRNVFLLLSGRPSTESVVPIRVEAAIAYQFRLIDHN
ncbi:MAG: hypothetical protein KTR25_01950 [Myxococcales bacterium]|nr:hypothetical protein [Myxococcales bacterium]